MCCWVVAGCVCPTEVCLFQEFEQTIRNFTGAQQTNAQTTGNYTKLYENKKARNARQTARLAAQEAVRLESEEAAVLAKIETSRLVKQRHTVKTNTQAAALEKEVAAKENTAHWERKQQQEGYLADSRQQVNRPLDSKSLIHQYL